MKVGGAPGKKIWVVPLHFFGSKSTISRFGERGNSADNRERFRDGQYSLVGSVSFLLLFFYSRCPRAQPFVKVGARAPPRCPMESAPLRGNLLVPRGPNLYIWTAVSLTLSAGTPYLHLVMIHRCYLDNSAVNLFRQGVRVCATWTSFPVCSRRTLSASIRYLPSGPTCGRFELWSPSWRIYGLVWKPKQL